MKTKILLAGDVGGTNTRLLLTEYAGEVSKVIFENDYASLEYAEFYDVLERFLQDSACSLPIDAACFGVAGPVKDNESSVTNLPWVIKAKKICDILNTSAVTLINDFVAVSYGVSVLEAKDVIDIQCAGTPTDANSHPTSVLIGAGTGLGVSCRLWANDHYQIISSEAGHTNFSPATHLQTELLMWLQKTYSYVSLESILSGRGFETIYTFLRDVKKIPESSVVRESMNSGNPAKIITDAALTHKDELCDKTLELFIQIYGSAAGNSALNYYSVDEVFIAGGIAPKIKQQINSRLFIDAFNQKGLMTSNMKKINIKLIMQDKVGLYGALSILY